MDADQASQVLQRLRLLELGTGSDEQLNERRGAEHALVEPQNTIAQLDHALQQGGRPATSAGQVVDTIRATSITYYIPERTRRCL